MIVCESECYCVRVNDSVWVLVWGEGTVTVTSWQRSSPSPSSSSTQAESVEHPWADMGLIRKERRENQLSNWKCFTSESISNPRGKTDVWHIQTNKLRSYGSKFIEKKTFYGCPDHCPKWNAQLPHTNFCCPVREYTLPQSHNPSYRAGIFLADLTLLSLFMMTLARTTLASRPTLRRGTTPSYNGATPESGIDPGSFRSSIVSRHTWPLLSLTRMNVQQNCHNKTAGLCDWRSPNDSKITTAQEAQDLASSHFAVCSTIPEVIQKKQEH